jgi:hypothetical protein
LSKETELEKKKDHEQLYYFGYFKKLYESWEESTNMMMDIWLKSPYMDRAFDKSLEFKNYVQNFMEDTLESRCGLKKSNKDSKDKLVEYIDSLEEKILELEEKVQELESEPKKKTQDKRKKTKDEAAKETK